VVGDADALVDRKPRGAETLPPDEACVVRPGGRIVERVGGRIGREFDAGPRRYASSPPESGKDAEKPDALRSDLGSVAVSRFKLRPVATTRWKSERAGFEPAIRV